MPLSSTTISELKCAVARLDFLLTVSNVKLKKIIPDTKCSICQEVFNKDGWRFGETANAPVKLNCGHVLGIQWWVLFVVYYHVMAIVPFAYQLTSF